MNKYDKQLSKLNKEQSKALAGQINGAYTKGGNSSKSNSSSNKKPPSKKK